MTNFTIEPGGTYTLAEGDSLLAPVLLKSRDKAGIAISKAGSADVWTYEYVADKTTRTFKVNGSAALRFAGMEGSLFAYTLPVLVKDGSPVKTGQRNGLSLSNSLNGYYEDVQRMVAPFVFDGGARAIRIPVKHDLLVQNGVVQDAVSLNGYSTKQWLALQKIIDFALAEDVAVVIDDHKYLKYSDPVVLAFWLALGAKLKEVYGDNDLIHLELQNETSKGGWDADYAQSVKALVEALRAAGVNFPVIVGWGDWNAVSSYNKALTAFDAIGGPEKIDPLGKLAFSAHYYPTTTGNDQPASGKNSPQIKGSALSPSFAAMFTEFERRGLGVWITEIGMGGGARGWLSNGSGVPEFNGKAWFDELAALVAKYPKTVKGVLAWGGGSAWADTYPFKIEYAKDNWSATKSTEFWRSITAFWNPSLVG